MHKIIQKIITIIKQLLENNKIDTKVKQIRLYLMTDEDSLDDLLQRYRNTIMNELGVKVFVTIDIFGEEQSEIIINHKVLFTDGALSVLIY